MLQQAESYHIRLVDAKDEDRNTWGRAQNPMDDRLDHEGCVGLEEQA